ncbi:62_t:CDS:2 [Acaulospora colombiana]|uniref:62_t:CDS:1 n=1 Tax=Acaulospora colombiana TaxID=27376 RepID=A0ACA9MDJ5_9GLOM|nr:62_t:CDS:2 [Acaulospora colombiana]
MRSLHVQGDETSNPEQRLARDSPCENPYNLSLWDEYVPYTLTVGEGQYLIALDYGGRSLVRENISALEIGAGPKHSQPT